MVPSGVRALFALLVLAGARAEAQPSPLGQGRPRFEYARYPGANRCPEEAEVRDAVASRLGFVPFVDDARARVRATVARTGRGHRARIELIDEAGTVVGEREVSAPGADCAELVSAMTLAISIAMDSLGVRAPEPVPPSPVPPEPPSPSTPEPTLPANTLPSPPVPPESPPPRSAPRSFESGPERAHAARSGLGVRVGVGAVFTLGAPPVVAPGAMATVGLSWRSLSLSLEGRWDLPSTLNGEAGAKADTDLVAASLVGCVHLGPSEAWGLCGVGAVGWLSGRGRGVDHPREGVVTIVTLGIRGEGEVALGRWLSLRFHADLGYPVRRGVVYLDGAVVWEAPPLQVGVGLGVMARFP